MKFPEKTEIRKRAGILLIGFVILFLILQIYSNTRLYDISEAFLESSLKLSGLTYGTCRVLNGLISAVQESTVTFSLGFGVELAVGQVLDPINDAIERLSNLASISLGLTATQNILFKIAQSQLIYFVYFFYGIFSISYLLSSNPKFNQMLFRGLVILLLALFSIPTFAYMGAKIDQKYFEPQFVKIEKEFKDIKEYANQHEEEWMKNSKLSVSSGPRIQPGIQNSLSETNPLNTIEKSFRRINQFITTLSSVLRNQMDQTIGTINQTRDTLSYIYERKTQLIDALSDYFIYSLAKILFQVLLIPLITFYISRVIYHFICDSIYTDER